jgi:L-ascorbate metabolism protein UlaG (beta-lactamase superfamily)
LKTPFLKDEPFLEELQHALDSGRFKIWWLGQSGFAIARGGRLVVLDPYLSDSLTRKYAGTNKPHMRITQRVVNPEALAALGVIDAISSSHNHTDHLDAETLWPLLKGNPNAKLIVPAANRTFVLDRLGQEFSSQLREVDEHQSMQIGDIEFHGVAAAHNAVERDEQGRCKYLGYVMRWGNRAFYHSGDTLWHEGLVPTLKPFKVDLALVPINGNRPERGVAGNLDGRQAAQLSKEIGAGIAIPCHFDLFEFNTATTDEFVAECERLTQSYRVLGQGEGLEL